MRKSVIFNEKNTVDFPNELVAITTSLSSTDQ